MNYLAFTNSSDAYSKATNIKELLDRITEIYNRVETSLYDQLSQHFSSVSIGMHKATGHFVTKNSGVQAKWNRFNTYKHTSIRKDKSFESYIRNGICVGASASYSLYSINNSVSSKYAGSDAKIELVNVKGSVDVGASLYSNGKLKPNIYAEFEAKASLLSSKVNTSIGSALFGATSSLELEVGAVYAEAGAKYSHEGVSLKAKVGAHAAKIKASGGIHIFGFYLELEVGAIIGGVSAGFEYEQKKNEVVVGAEASLFGGLGIKLKFGKGD